MGCCTSAAAAPAAAPMGVVPSAASSTAGPAASASAPAASQSTAAPAASAAAPAPASAAATPAAVLPAAGGGDNHLGEMWAEVLTELQRESAIIAQKVTERGAADGQQLPRDELKAFCEAEKQKFCAQRTAAFEKVFGAYDANRDQTLDRKETAALTADMLRAQQARAAQEVGEIVDMSARVMAKQHGLSVESVRPQLQGVAEAMTQKLVRGFEALLTRVDVVAARLFVGMDENGDGRVSKAEFLRHYDRISTELIDTEKMLA